VDDFVQSFRFSFNTVSYTEYLTHMSVYTTLDTCSCGHTHTQATFTWLLWYSTTSMVWIILLNFSYNSPFIKSKINPNVYLMQKKNT
jgi:hypothetical protein